ncbi:MAG: type II secretion system F family protein [Armatimonadetes bacterium]|nr:type II secretion system F family protein [Armatimonadota bacterium]
MTRPLVQFFRVLQCLYEAGIPLVRCFWVLASQETNPRLRTLYLNLEASLSRGEPLADSCRKHKEFFSPLHTALMKAGEHGGVLGAVLERLAQYEEHSQNLTRKVKAATTYPLFAFVVCLAVVYFLSQGIVVNLVGHLEAMGGHLPITTAILLQFVRITRHPAFLIALPLACAGIYLWCRRWIGLPGHRYLLDLRLLNLPLFGPILLKLAVSRFCRVLALLYDAGVNISDALELASDSAGNEAVRRGGREVAAFLIKGETVSGAFRYARIFPSIVINMISVGSESGDLPEMVGKAASVYELEVESGLSIYVQAVQPLMIFFIGGLVGFVALATLGPLLQLLEKL